MTNTPGRRTSKDEQWQQVKQEVMQRDGGRCRLCRCLTAVEFLQLKRHAKQWMSTLDPAHYLPVGQNPGLCYNPDNICMVNHWSHSNLDSCRSPVTGEHISPEEVQQWWDRILRTNPEQYRRIKALEPIELPSPEGEGFLLHEF